MGNEESTLAPKQDAVGSAVGVSLETFQETVDNIKTAADTLQKSFTQVLTSTRELEKYLFSIPELITGDDQSSSQGTNDGCKYKSQITKFQTSVAHNETETNKSIQDFLEFAKQQMENIGQSPTDYENVRMSESFVFPDQDVEEEDATRRNEQRSIVKGEQAKKTSNFQDIIAVFKTQVHLLNEKVEQYDSFYEDGKKRAEAMESCVAEMKTKRAELEKELQMERIKINNLEELKKEKEILESNHSRMSKEIHELQIELSKQAATHEQDKKNWSQQIKEKEDAVDEKYQLDLQEKDRKAGLAYEEINELKYRKNQLEIQQKNNLEELARFQQHNVKLKADLHTQIEEKDKQNAELLTTKEKLEQVNREMRELQEQNSRNNNAIVAIRKEADKFKKEHQIISEEFGNLFKKHEQTVLELAHWESIKTLKIQLYSSSRGDMLSAVEEELMKMLKSKLENERQKLEFIQCSKQSEIQPDLPTLLLCITASRLGTDATHAINGLTSKLILKSHIVYSNFMLHANLPRKSYCDIEL